MGYGNNTFRSLDTLSRTEAVAIPMRAFGFGESEKELNFADKETLPAWAGGYASRAVELGIITGYGDNTFRSDKKVTCAELFCMLSRCLESVRK